MTTPFAAYCDSCHQPIDTTLEPGRFRHHDCPPPPLPDVAYDVLAHIDNLRDRNTP